MQNPTQVKLIIYNTHVQIEPPIRGNLYQLFKKELGYKPLNVMWIAPTYSGWDGWISLVCFDKKRCKCSLKKDGMHFPSGLFSQAKTFFDKNSIKFDICDMRSNITRFDLSFNDNFSLRDYQEVIVNDSVRKTRGMIRAATGAGKTICAAGIFSKIKASPSIFFVTSLDLMNQAYEEFTKFLSPSSSIGIIGGGKFKPSKINVMTVQTAVRSLGFKVSKASSDDDDGIVDDDFDFNNENKKNIAELIHNTGCIIADECITGDSLVTIRDFGEKRIDDIENLVGNDILTHDGDNIVWRRLTGFSAKGLRDILSITLKTGVILKCTSEHPIMTSRGWIEAGQLMKSDMILCIPNVVAKKKFQPTIKEKTVFQDIFLVIKILRQVLMSGNINITFFLKKLRYVCLDVIRKLACALVLLLKLDGIINTCMVMIKDQYLGISNYLQKKLEIIYTCLLRIICHKICSINYVGIDKIDNIDKDYVYDISVDGTHCFFANGILVHNCHHWSAISCQIISDHCMNARYRFGISATPWRDLEDDILIDSCFGKKICDVNASFLIKKGVLVKPFINMIKMVSKMGGTYADVYKAGIVENDLRNEVVRNCAEYLANNGRRVLILVKQIKHGEFLEYSIPNSVFLHGSCSPKDRKDHIEKMRNSSSVITIASSIFDEGIDVKPLDALVLAGGGKSQTRALQRIGRTLRPFSNKKNAIVVDFYDDMKYMRNHSKKRMKIYSTEKEFDIKTFDFNEIVKNPSVLLRTS